MNFLKPLLNIGAIPAPTSADVDTAIKTAEPEASFGWFIKSATAPDVVANPLFARFTWSRVVSGQLNGEFYWYNGTAWEQVVTDDGARLLPGTIPLDRMLPPASSAGYVQRVNSVGDDFEVVPANTLFPTATFTIEKLQGGPDAAKVYMLLSNAGTRTWQEATTEFLLGRITEIPVTKLAKPVGQKLLGLVGADVAWGTPAQVLEDGTIPLGKMQKDEAKKGYYFRYNPLTGLAEAAEVNAGMGGGVVVVSELFAMPIAPAIRLWNHGLGEMPHEVHVYIECKIATDGWVVGDRLDYSVVTSTAAASERPLYAVKVSGLSVEVTAYNAQTGYYPVKTGGEAVFDPLKWELRIIVARGTSTGTVFATADEAVAGVEVAKAISPATLRAVGNLRAHATVRFTHRPGGASGDAAFTAATMVTGSVGIASFVFVNVGGGDNYAIVTFNAPLLKFPHVLLSPQGDITSLDDRFQLMTANDGAIPLWSKTVSFTRQSDTVMWVYPIEGGIAGTDEYIFQFAIL